MNNPIDEISDVVIRLTQGSPRTQQETLERYFLPNASFIHPFCSVYGNRDAIVRIYQWYKILSPRIEIKINSIAFDERNLVLYVNISQVFSIFFVPFYRAPVTLTAVLQLVHQSSPSQSKTTDIDIASPQQKRYFIASQNDLYQVDQFIRFILPLGGATLILIWHWLATVSCIIGARLFSPLTRRNQALADAHPRYPDVATPAKKRASVNQSPARHDRTNTSESPARHGRANASEILALHGRANGPSSPVTGFVAESASPDREPSLQHLGMNGDSLRDLRRRGRPGSLKSL